ncbi:MAG: ferrous iron transporter B, partial [Clostridia bacterium]|nr:ferrous iron transporter B [Clostridia bacterium]
MKRIAVVGNPNAGKSTLINSLTGANLKVGNWHGVTVGREDRSYTYLGEEYILSDLPGVYSLKSSLAEEGETLKALRGEKYDGIILVADAKTLPKGLKLLNELIAYDLPVVAIVNFNSEFERGGGKIDEEKLSKSVKIKFFFFESNDKKSAENFKAALKAEIERGGDYKPIEERTIPEIFQPMKKKKKLGDLFLNPAVAYLTFIFFVFSSVYIAFGENSVGAYFSDGISVLVGALSEKASEFLSGFCSPFLSDLAAKGIIGGVGSVAAFLPQIAITSACLEFAEQSGYLSRLAVVSDGLLVKFGLSGKAVYSLLGGFGCGAVAAALAQGIDDEGVKRRAVLSTPLVSCSAKTPVYTYIAKFCFKKYAFIVIGSIYLLSVALSLLNAVFLYKTAVKTPPEPLLAELADIRLPNARHMFKSTFMAVKNFAVRLGTVIVLSSAFLFILSSVTVDFSYAPTG